MDNCCCIQTYNFCKQPVCGSIDFGITASVNGVHKLVLDHLGMQVTLSAEFAINDPILFDILDLNESFEYTGKIFDPLGEVITIPVEAVEYDCIKFRTIINLSSEAAVTEVPADPIDKFQLSEDGTYELDPAYMIYKIAFLPTAADSLAIETSVGAGDIRFPDIPVVPDIWDSITKDIFPDPILGTTILFNGVTAPMTVIIYKLPL